METPSVENKPALLDETKAHFSKALAGEYALDEALEVALQIHDRALKNIALRHVAIDGAGQGKRDFSFGVIKLISDGPEKIDALVCLIQSIRGLNEPFSDRIRLLLDLLGTAPERQKVMESLLVAYILRGSYNDVFGMARLMGRELSTDELERLLHKTKERLRARKNSP